MRFLTRATLLLSLVLGACAPASTGSLPPAPAAPAGTERAEKQDLKLAISGIAGNLTPQASVSAFYQFYPMYDNLTQFGQNFDVRPGVAEKWDLSADGRTWTFTIRKDMTWPNGDKLTAEDVAFTFNNMNERSWPQRSFFSTVTGAKATSETAVEVTTRQPDMSVPNGGPFFWIIPKKYFEQVGFEGFRDKPMGSGPYEVAEYRPGDSIRFKKKTTPHAYRRAQADEILLRAVPEVSAQVAGLRTGELDMVVFGNFPAEQADRLRNEGLVVLAFPISNLSFTIHQAGNELRQTPLLDKRVRQALNYAINREAMARTIYKGFAQPTGQYAVPGSLYHDPAVQPVPYDPARAKALLAEAGYPNGFKLPAGIDFSPMILADIPLAVQGYLREIGVEADLRSNDTVTINDKLFGRNNQVMADIYAGGTGDQNGFATTIRTLNGCGRPAGGGPNSTHYCNPEWDRLLDAALAERDPVRRAQIMRQANQIQRDDLWFIFIMLQPLYAIHSPKLKEVQIPFLGAYNLDSAYKVK